MRLHATWIPYCTPAIYRVSHQWGNRILWRYFLFSKCRAAGGQRHVDPQHLQSYTKYWQTFEKRCSFNSTLSTGLHDALRWRCGTCVVPLRRRYIYIEISAAPPLCPPIRWNICGAATQRVMWPGLYSSKPVLNFMHMELYWLVLDSFRLLSNRLSVETFVWEYCLFVTACTKWLYKNITSTKTWLLYMRFTIIINV